MNTAAVISVGNELLNGRCLDTNQKWLSGKLAAMGVIVRGAYTCPDELDTVRDLIINVCGSVDFLLITGGLGPTDDDITREAVAAAAGVDLEFNQELYNVIKAYFDQRGLVMSEKNRCQAYLPAGSAAIPNPVGTAPGVLAEISGTLVASMPGVPAEMYNMFTGYMEAIISKKLTGHTVTRLVKCMGIGESVMAEMLGDKMLRDRMPLINCTVSDGIITLYIQATAGSKKEADEQAEKEAKEIRQILKPWIFSESQDGPVEVLIRELSRRGEMLSLAESCTGGLIAKMITDVPGSSSILDRAWVTYSNESKIEELGVSSSILERYGAVSSETAKQMALGALKNSRASVAAAVTGIAGPAGGTDVKPVGTVYAAMAYKTKCSVKKLFYPQGREVCRNRTAQSVLLMLLNDYLHVLNQR
ncbi:Nicotinamide-nucleotide amidohydrolase PncC [Limihaloglobus sulfuriphilus]|uniref:CinA-like protein n=1 Tax=Limihaloglobus sulfuriphilus TaxID=1851148 RepID=A0A1Q2MBP8_9BACT|nr:CinA family nicotinamide mononucleotide deamidase-related protein [Limihaloglobus sulfuriphilus]AQQ70111.1 Nicotinamide-nucleotide amidohydrolase PncC [Limihaloglobus sulfuriphilus]